MKRLLGFGAAIAALTWFFDPQNGARRRHVARDRVLAFFRQGGRKTARAGRVVAAEAYGLKQKATHLREEEKELDDVTLARKVETELFRPADAPKGQVNVNVEGGVVYLRGEVESVDVADEMVALLADIPGVDEVIDETTLTGFREGD